MVGWRLRIHLNSWLFLHIGLSIWKERWWCWVFIHQDFHFPRVALPFDFKSFEGLFVRLELHHRSMLLGVIYRPPNISIKLLNDEFQLLLDNITKRRNCVLLGDFNLDLLSNSKEVQEFQSTPSSHGLHPRITQPTRVTSKSATIIDNIFSNIYDRDSIMKIIIDPLTRFASSKFLGVIIADHLSFKSHITFVTHLTCHFFHQVRYHRQHLRKQIAQSHLTCRRPKKYMSVQNHKSQDLQGPVDLKKAGDGFSEEEVPHRLGGGRCCGCTELSMLM